MISKNGKATEFDKSPVVCTEPHSTTFDEVPLHVSMYYFGSTSAIYKLALRHRGILTI